MSEEEPREVGKILPRSKATSRSLTASEMKSRVKVAMTTSGTQMGSGGNFYSPELSTDFLELPQSQDEQRNYFRFFYRTDPFVGQAVDLQVGQILDESAHAAGAETRGYRCVVQGIPQLLVSIHVR